MMKQGWAKAALAGAAIFGMVQMGETGAAQAGPVPGVGSSHEATACTRDGKRATLFYDLAVSPHFYWHAQKLSTPELKAAFLKELEEKVAQPMDEKWISIAGQYSAADILEGRVSPKRDFLHATRAYIDTYGNDRTSSPNIEVILTGGRLVPDPVSCPGMS